jgi:hypothetical protein
MDKEKEIKETLIELGEVSARMKFVDAGLSLIFLILLVYLIGYNVWQDRHIERLEAQIQLVQ